MTKPKPKKPPPKKAITPAPVGRPSKYDPKFCTLIVEHMTGGASIASFAASIDVARDSISEWAVVHPEFSAALKRGKAACAAWWEERLRSVAKDGGASGAATATIFGLKNMASDDWRETSTIKHEMPDTSGLSLEEIDALLGLMAKITPTKQG